LMEALPYIKRFHNKLVVIKYGGADQLRRDFVRDIVFLKFVGLKPVVIHGGGAAISRKLKEAGKETKFIDGLRVTDSHTLSVVEDTLMLINAGIADSIREAGWAARGFSGKDFIMADKIGEKFGFVGEVHSVNKGLHDAANGKPIPVIAPLGFSKKDGVLNINADEVASCIAAELAAEKLVLMTDVSGIIHERKVVSTLTATECEKFIAKGVVGGGMVPKVRACINALGAGVGKAHILDGRIKHALLLEIFTDRGVGTEIISGE